jgi:hypothetical protein
MTGSTNQGNDVVGKLVSLLKEVIPLAIRIAILGNARSASHLLWHGIVQDAAKKVNLEIAVSALQRSSTSTACSPISCAVDRRLCWFNRTPC